MTRNFKIKRDLSSSDFKFRVKVSFTDTSNVAATNKRGYTLTNVTTNQAYTITANTITNVTYPSVSAYFTMSIGETEMDFTLSVVDDSVQSANEIVKLEMVSSTSTNPLVVINQLNNPSQSKFATMSYLIQEDDLPAQTFTITQSESGNGRWEGGVLGKNGKVYGVPSNSPNVLVIDPTTDAVSYIAHGVSGSGLWRYGTLAPNGFIYCCPVGSSSILKIDTNNPTATVSTISNGGFTGVSSSVLAPNGFIYMFAPFKILKLNYNTDTITQIATPTGLFQGSAVLAPNGKIYQPRTGVNGGSTNHLLVFNPATDTFVQVSNGSLTDASSANWKGGALGSDGNIYFFPSVGGSGGGSILKVNTANDTISNVSTPFTGVPNAFAGANTAANNKIYGMPQGYTNIVEFDINTLTYSNLPPNLNNVSQFSYAGGVLAPNGCIYTIPYSQQNIIKIDTGQVQSSTDNQVPVSLSGLASSNYNRYHNKA